VGGGVLVSAFDSVADGTLADSALERARRLVELESPSSDHVGLRAIAGDLAAALAALGSAVETVEVDVGEHLVARIAGSTPDLDPVLVLTHFDTVHPVGSFDPVFRVDRDRAYGPGIFDMKGGLACMLEALARLREAGAAPRRPVLFLASCDEETGSATSRALIEELAASACVVLVPEPPLPGGLAKTRRKGVAGYRIAATGRASHAGLAPEDGINAVVEIAHQVLAVTALADPAAGTTTSVGLLEGGTATNVVPAAAAAWVDVRFTSAGEARRVDASIRGLEPRLEGATLTIEGGVNRPPMERSAGTAALFDTARAIAAADGWELGEGLSGGASDGSFTAGLGRPTLDGIGPDGGGAHARDEHVLIGDLARRVRLYGRLFERL
jgi:glutamate carboxypeptidase